MKKLNFNSLKNISVPESWIETALNAKPKKKPFFFRPYVIGTAASLVIVAMAVVTLRFHSENAAPFSPKTEPYARSPIVTVTEPETTSSKEFTTPQKSGAHTVSTEGSVATQEVSALTTAPKRQTETNLPDALTTFSAAKANEPIQTTKDLEPETSPENPHLFEMTLGFGGVCRIDSSDDNHPSKPTMLSIDKLFTGNIVIKASAKSKAMQSKELYCEVSAVYEPTGEAIYGIFDINFSVTATGAKKTVLNPFSKGIYLPSDCEYTLTFKSKSSERSQALATVTPTLSGNKTTIITL